MRLLSLKAKRALTGKKNHRDKDQEGGTANLTDTETWLTMIRNDHSVKKMAQSSLDTLSLQYLSVSIMRGCYFKCS